MSGRPTIVVQVPEGCLGCGQPLPPDSPHAFCSSCSAARALAEGDRRAVALGCIGNYELLGEIARGGMGIVYRARDLKLKRTVALKMIVSGHLATAAEVARFKVEAEAAARLEHPNIIPIYEVGEVAGRPFFTMKFVQGGSLGEALAGGRLTAVQAAQLLAKVAHGVHYAHQRGVLHRDIKPNNILLEARDEPHLTDFGLAKIADHEADLTRSLAVMGSASYMAPEQARGEAKQLTISSGSWFHRWPTENNEPGGAIRGIAADDHDVPQRKRFYVL